MTDNNKHLVRVGHEFAAAMSDDTPIITIAKMVTELASALDVQSARSDALAAENAALKATFDKPQAYLSWHAIPPTWDEPLPCGEYLDVHDTDGHKNSDGTDCWPVFAKPEIETPNTDAWVNEQRAVGVEMFAAHLRTNDNERSPAKLLALGAEEFAAQLRGSQV